MTTRIAIDFSTEIDGLCRNCHGDHHIQACPQIARFDPVAELRAQLATAHEAIGAALALVRQQSYGAAEIVLEHALKGKPMHTDDKPGDEKPIDIPDEKPPITPGGPTPPEWDVAMGGGGAT